jgi:transcriptional regulator with XRE-family HTH domain
MNKVYENIKAIRQSLGLTQTDVAYEIGIAVNNYGKLERGEIQLTIERLEELSKVFGMTTIEILEYNTPKDTLSHTEKDNEIRALKEKIEDMKMQLQDKSKLIAYISDLEERLEFHTNMAATVLNLVDKKVFDNNELSDAKKIEEIQDAILQLKVAIFNNLYLNRNKNKQ